MSNFDPYYDWLGIPPEDRSINFYALLGLKRFEKNIDAIEAAADQKMAYVQQCATGGHVKESQRLLTELSKARVTLCHPVKKEEYDAKLRKVLAGSRRAAAEDIASRQTNKAYRPEEPRIGSPSVCHRWSGCRRDTGGRATVGLQWRCRNSRCFGNPNGRQPARSNRQHNAANLAHQWRGGLSPIRPDTEANQDHSL